MRAFTSTRSWSDSSEGCKGARKKSGFSMRGRYRVQGFRVVLLINCVRVSGSWFSFDKELCVRS